MLDLFNRFCEDLKLPPGTRENLVKPRDDEEMKVYLKNLPTLLYPDTYKLAGRLLIFTNIKNIPKKIESYVSILRGLLRDEICDFMLEHKEKIDTVLYETYHSNFLNHDILSASSNINYLLKVSADEPPVETPCQLMMRQAVQFYFEDGIDHVLKCYYELLNQYYVHASPTMFNSGVKKNQLASCFSEDTKVYTYNRGYIPIVDVKIGDEVPTHKGNRKRVVQLHKNALNGRQMYRVKCTGSDEFKVTGNHRFWVEEMHTLQDFSCEWVEISKLGTTNYDFIRSYEGNNKYNFRKVEHVIAIDEKPEFVYTLGVEDDHSYCVEGVIAENCFLLSLGDNLESLLYSGAGDVGLISKLQGGIGLSLSAIRHSNVSNTGKSSGVLPFGQIYDATIKCVNQGGKRNGAMTITLNDWHVDFIDFIQTRDNYTHNGIRFKQANICAFVSKLFMDRVAKKEDWTFFCPAKVSDLVGLSGPDFEEKYLEYESFAKSSRVAFDILEAEIKELETIMNTGEYNESDSIKYYQKTVKRVKMRKNLIDFKIERADKVYSIICNMQIRSSMPYLCYRDAMNLKNNTSNIAPTMSSNLCVAPETLILTDKGHFKIVDLKNKKVNVWNGKEFSETKVKQTGIGQELIKIKMNDGTEIECTKYHKFYIQEKNFYHKFKYDILENKFVKEVRAGQLKEGMRIIKCDYPIIDNGPELEDAYTNGFFSGDGTYNRAKNKPSKCKFKATPGKAYCKKHLFFQKDEEKSKICLGYNYVPRPSCYLYGVKRELLPFLNHTSHGINKDNRISVQLTPHLKPKFFVPINYSMKSKMKWLSGYLDADGSCTVSNEGKRQSICLVSINKEFLKNIKLMLQTCGFSPNISVLHTRKTGVFPDRKGGTEICNTKTAYYLNITHTDIQKLLNLGLQTKRVEIKKMETDRYSVKFVKVEKIITTGRISDTFCFTEPKRNLGVFNGIICGNCLEITLPANEDMISSCNLGHLSLKKFATFTRDALVTKENITEFYDFEGLAKMTRALVRNINKVIDYNYYPLDKRDKAGNVIEQGKISKPNFDNRPLGIGVSGLAEAFAYLNLPYDSDLAFYLNKLIFACMYFNAMVESKEMAEVHGPYKNFNTGTSKVFVDGKWQTIPGSKLSNGFFQFDLWHQETEYLKSIGRFNSAINNEDDNQPLDPSLWGQEATWEELREEVIKHGVYNSMLIALMPTASSAQLLRNAETTEAHQTLIYSRKLVHGNYTAYSEPFVWDMQRMGLWNKHAIDFMEMDNGSFQNFHIFFHENQKLFPDCKASHAEILWMQKVHKGMYEISQKATMQMARQRGIYVCQSQSFNVWLGEPNMTKMKAIHAYGNALNLKTGMYYLRANPASQTNRFTVSLDMQEYYKNMKSRKKAIKERRVVCKEDVCIMCE